MQIPRGEILYAVRGPKTLFEMTQDELAEARRHTDIAVIPVGSIEGHGPHMPLGSDAMLAAEYARRIVLKCAERGVRIVAAPTIAFGVNPHTLPLPGTIHLRPATLIALVEDVARSLIQHGFANLVLLLGHNGNWPALQVAAQNLAADTSATVIAVNWVPAFYRQQRAFMQAAIVDSHGGESEASRLMAAHPELVHLDRVTTGHLELNRPTERPADGDVDWNIFVQEKDFRRAAPASFIGAPHLASREKGERALEMIADYVADVIMRAFAQPASRRD
ncbi:MAG TPA: creatininase family protein [Dehalococcoidia bacterium]|nr:creatininase family protein [Dehalococcoidia bacterium]